MNTAAETPLSEDEWSMGGSKEPGLEAYGINEIDIAMCALDAILYAMHKAGGNVPRFAYELSGEFMRVLHERLGIEVPEE